MNFLKYKATNSRSTNLHAALKACYTYPFIHWEVSIWARVYINISKINKMKKND